MDKLAEGCQRPPAYTRYSTNAGPMLGKRRRLWASIDPTIGQYLVFTGKFDITKHRCFTTLEHVEKQQIK